MAGIMSDLSVARSMFASMSMFASVEPHFIFHLAGYIGAESERRFVLAPYTSLLTGTINVLLATAEN
jgi:hypothetical protein